ncbi:hypothetical protein [Yoonia algicola]|uniref:Uncharacterized protein n=1 Tax=Yoonia algicola TaxID=3137368 RepID=A0AAN0NI15_9RHOB
MTTMMDIAHPEQAMQAGVAQFAQASTPYHIKRAGSRPLRFEGSELAMAMSFTPAIPYWYEINVYRTAQQSFVAAVRLFHQAEDRQDTVRAWEAASLDDAIEKLISYDAAHDVSLGVEFDVTTAPASETGALALQLLARISDIRHHYHSLVGEFLYDLENGH